MLHVAREILVLAAQARTPPTLPAPPEIAAVVLSLIEANLLSADPRSRRVTVTDRGRSALGVGSAAITPSPVTP